MNVQEYIDSGILHDYIMGSLTAAERAGVEQVCALYPEIQAELKNIRAAIDHFADDIAVTTPAEMQDNIWDKLDNINKERTGDINALPVVNKYSDHNNWKRIVAPFMPQTIPAERIARTLRHSGGVTQVLIISTTDVEEEVHEHEQESFIILEGECECYVGDNVIRLGPGGFIDIPLHVNHNVKILSPYVVAVLQHVAIPLRP